jgi:hypothetical protein
MRMFKKTIFIILITVVGGFSLWTWGALTYVYSKGERAGYLQKISQKGWLCKTWEGELAMQTLPGSMPELFYFSVHDKAVVAELKNNIGQRISLGYDEHRGIPTTCFGETSYFATSARRIDPVSIGIASPADSKTK